MGKLKLDIYIFVAIGLTLVGSSEAQSYFSCGTLNPLTEAVSGSPSNSVEAPIQLTLLDLNNHPTNNYQPGSYLIVKLKFVGSVNIKAFVFQASKVLEQSPVGRWEIIQPLSKLTVNSCANQNDTLFDNGIEVNSYDTIQAYWYPPSTLMDSIEFLASAIDVAGNYWIKWNSFELSTY